ncbi:MAG: VCBS repeat-containing protein [Planctomycetota bacterium]
MLRPWIACALASISPLLAQPGDAGADGVGPTRAPFARQQLSERYWSEGIGTGDFNRDGHRDVVCGPYYYAGPDFRARQATYPPLAFPIQLYSNNFCSFGDDVDRDGWDDVLVIGFPGQPAYWLRNPGGGGPWTRYQVLASVGTESPEYVDLDGDGRRELLCATAGQLGFAKPDSADPTALWSFTAISGATSGWGPFTHGLGAGDVNGDDRRDVLTAVGWFEQPSSLVGAPSWRFHAVAFGAGGAQMFAYDVDGDGDRDVITSIRAHGYGLSWFENVRAGGGGIAFREHVILGKTAAPGEGLQFSQLHALGIADFDGDGLVDLVTGKTYWAHLGTDPGATDPAVLCVFHLRRAAGRAWFEPRLVDSDSGVGRQVVVDDVDRDGRPDVLVGNKKGVFVFRNR